MHRPPPVGHLVAALAATLLLGAGISGRAPTDPASGSAATADEQVTNVGSGSATIVHSLVEGGLPAGSVDGGGNLDTDPQFGDPDGFDRIPGTIDDGLALADGSPAADAGSRTYLPADRFDLDGDGDTSEPVPTDLAGAPRSRGAAVDLGALESPGGPVSRERMEIDLAVELDLPHPNPLRGDGEASFRVPRSERVQIAMYDVLGRRRGVLFDDVAAAGQSYRLSVPSTGLASGVYLLRLESASFRKSTEFVVAR